MAKPLPNPPVWVHQPRCPAPSQPCRRPDRRNYYADRGKGIAAASSQNGYGSSHIALKCKNSMLFEGSGWVLVPHRCVTTPLVHGHVLARYCAYPWSTRLRMQSLKVANTCRIGKCGGTTSNNKQQQAKANNKKKQEATSNKQQCATRQPTRINQQNASDNEQGLNTQQ